ncbi:DUF6086 family protein [Actinoplanes sp. CA-054009]
MTYTFEFQDEGIWWPANQAGQVYIGMLTTAAEYAKRPTGLTDELGSGDLWKIDPVEFPELVAELLRLYAENKHWMLHVMLTGVLAVSIDLLDRVGAAPQPHTDQEQNALAELRALMTD